MEVLPFRERYPARCVTAGVLLPTRKQFQLPLRFAVVPVTFIPGYNGPNIDKRGFCQANRMVGDLL